MKTCVCPPALGRLARPINAGGGVRRRRRRRSRVIAEPAEPAEPGGTGLVIVYRSKMAVNGSGMSPRHHSMHSCSVDSGCGEMAACADREIDHITLSTRGLSLEAILCELGIDYSQIKSVIRDQVLLTTAALDG